MKAQQTLLLIISKLPELPTVGGRNAVLSKNFNIGINQEPEELLYGTTLRTIPRSCRLFIRVWRILKNTRICI